MTERITRREFIKQMAGAGAGLAVGKEAIGLNKPKVAPVSEAMEGVALRTTMDTERLVLGIPSTKENFEVQKAYYKKAEGMAKEGSDPMDIGFWKEVGPMGQPDAIPQDPSEQLQPMPQPDGQGLQLAKVVKSTKVFG